MDLPGAAERAVSQTVVSGTVPIFVAGRHKHGTVPFGPTLLAEGWASVLFVSLGADGGEGANRHGCTRTGWTLET